MADRNIKPVAITVPETALLARCSLDNVYAGVKDGTIPSVRIGHRIVVPVAGLERFLGGEITSAQIAAAAREVEEVRRARKRQRKPARRGAQQASAASK